MTKLMDALASLRLAVAVMVALALICGWATFYESSHGTAAAQRDFYQTWWFALLLGLLGVSILCAMLKRAPWKAHHAGFLVAHVGILVLLAGSLASLHFGLDSNMALYEGETSDRVELLTKSLQVALPGQAAYGTFPVSFEKDPPHLGREQRFRVPGSDATLVAEEFQPHVRVAEDLEEGARRSVTPAPLPQKEQRRMPAVRVRLETPSGATAPEWLLWTESRSVALPAGGAATVAYRSPQMQVPFRVALLKFNSEKYPGSQMAATYESWVRIEDPERGVSEHHISMNNPLHYRGYIFFQASFVEGRPMMSIFSVTRAPGLPLVYLGVGLISVGVVWMFYLKPYVARRQAARALEVRRAQPAPRQHLTPARGRA